MRNPLSDLPGCHRCGGDPLYQWTRRATADEAASQRREIARLQGRDLSDGEIAARYGPLRTAVAGCVEHHLGDDSGLVYTGESRRALLHDEYCAGHGSCECEEAAADGALD
jgi:hypothetical protein